MSADLGEPNSHVAGGGFDHGRRTRDRATLQRICNHQVSRTVLPTSARISCLEFGEEFEANISESLRQLDQRRTANAVQNASQRHFGSKEKLHGDVVSRS